MSKSFDLSALPADATFLRIHGVNYFHLTTDDEGELYLTEHGVPFLRQLNPENWYEQEWFETHRERLMGTGTVYRVPTRPIEQARPASVQLVVKWSRVGQDVPLDTFTVNRNIDSDFNSPFEEFSLLEELRRSRVDEHAPRILTQKPLGIYVPSERMQLWQTGRSRQKVLARVARHPGVEIDILRSYILLYGWVDGVDAVHAYRAITYNDEQYKRELTALTDRVTAELDGHGFVVADHKPTHCIVRMNGSGIRHRRNEKVAYALVDYELLSRTRQREDSLLTAGRREYLRRQRDRFNPCYTADFLADQHPATVMGVPYIVARTESTSGLVWVVGNDPELVLYFQPDRWHFRQVGLSDTGQTFYAQTRDRIHVVWKVSRVGEIPPGNLDDPMVRKRVLHGYNSPFEEFALALSLQRTGVPCVYPRAIYMTGAVGEIRGVVLDDRRFDRVKREISPLDHQIMPMDHDYVTIWGYFRGLEDDEAVADAKLWTPIDATQASAKRIIDPAELPTIMTRHAEMLAKAGFADLNLKPDHILLTYIPSGAVKRDATGQAIARQCNFEFVKRMSG